MKLSLSASLCAFLGLAANSPRAFADDAPPSPPEPVPSLVAPTVVTATDGPTEETSSASATTHASLDVRALSGMPGYKSRKLATRLAVGGTVAAWAIEAGGLALVLADDNSKLGGSMLLGGFTLSLIAPSGGHIYAGKYLHAALFSAGRAAGLLMVVAGSLEDTLPTCFDTCSGDEERGTGGSALIAGGLVLTVGLGLYDWATAGDAVDDYNRAKAKQNGVSLSLLPTVVNHGAGLAAVGTF